MSRLRSYLLISAVAGTAACAESEARAVPAGSHASTAATAVATDTLLPRLLDVDAVAAPMREATLSTRLMASVREVLVEEGEAVRAGQLLVRLDARDVRAKAEQVAAQTAAAEAQQVQAAAQAARLRALFVDDAAPKATLDAAEAALAQADAAVRAARAARDEVEVMGDHAEIRAPFAGRVTRRFVDAGALAAPGAPLVTVQDASRLRVSGFVTPDVARAASASAAVAVRVEGIAATARIEGVVPAPNGLHEINAIIDNRDGAHLAGSAAVLSIPQGVHRMLVIPVEAITRNGDLTGVTVRAADGEARRWVRLGARLGELVEVTSGLRAGEHVVLPRAAGQQ